MNLLPIHIYWVPAKVIPFQDNSASTRPMFHCRQSWQLWYMSQAYLPALFTLENHQWVSIAMFAPPAYELSLWLWNRGSRDAKTADLNNHYKFLALGRAETIKAEVQTSTITIALNTWRLHCAKSTQSPGINSWIRRPSGQIESIATP